MRELRIQIDTREQRPWVFPPEIPTVVRKLDAGDYAIYGDAGFAIERKSLDDFLGTAFSDWERFKRELARMDNMAAKVIVIEADYRQLCYAEANDGIYCPEHNHPNITPQAAACKIAELALMRVSCLFCANPEYAALQALFLLKVRNHQLSQIL